MYLKVAQENLYLEIKRADLLGLLLKIKVKFTL
jgi:hypothetical protein